MMSTLRRSYCLVGSTPLRREYAEAHMIDYGGNVRCVKVDTLGVGYDLTTRSIVATLRIVV